MEKKKMEIQIDNRQTKLKTPDQIIRKKTVVILNALGFDDGELSIVLTDDDEIAKLNSQYLGRTGPTNVIAFPMQEGEFSSITPGLLGDVVISTDTAEKEAENGGVGIEERFSELLIHGILHLFGYDHEQGGEEEIIMEEKTKELLNKIN